MKEFPDRLKVTNKSNFNIIYEKRVLCYLRRNIYEHMIREDENSYFDLDKFNSKYIQDMDKLHVLLKIVICELNILGWKCKTSFGDTGLFIYSSNELPKSCW
jgi:hypothetical protein